MPRATDEELEAFLAKFGAPGVAAPVIKDAPAAEGPRDLIDSAVLQSFFAKNAEGKWHCTAGETDEHECKQNFNLRNFSAAMKTIAGFASNRVGYLFFGVKDKPEGFAVCGLADDRFTATDQNKFSQTIRSVLEPTPRFRGASLVLDGATIADTSRMRPSPSEYRPGSVRAFILNAVRLPILPPLRPLSPQSSPHISVERSGQRRLLADAKTADF